MEFKTLLIELRVIQAIRVGNIATATLQQDWLNPLAEHRVSYRSRSELERASRSAMLFVRIETSRPSPPRKVLLLSLRVALTVTAVQNTVAAGRSAIVLATERGQRPESLQHR
jgi:hypothetical protein